MATSGLAPTRSAPARRCASSTAWSRSSLLPKWRWMSPRLTPASAAMSRNDALAPRAAKWRPAASSTAARTSSRPVGRPAGRLVDRRVPDCDCILTSVDDRLHLWEGPIRESHDHHACICRRTRHRCPPDVGAHRRRDPGRRPHQPHARARRRDPRHPPEVEGRLLPRPGPHAGAAHRVRPRVRRRHSRSSHAPRAVPRLPRDPAARQRRLRQPRRPADREPLALRRHVRGEPPDGVDPPRRRRPSLRRRHAVHQHRVRVRAAVARDP